METESWNLWNLENWHSLYIQFNLGKPWAKQFYFPFQISPTDDSIVCHLLFAHPYEYWVHIQKVSLLGDLALVLIGIHHLRKQKQSKNPFSHIKMHTLLSS